MTTLYRPKLLDLFCCAGGAGMGYFRAGFDVTGIDIKPQPHYPFAFIQADALDYVREHGHEYDAIHASPPCQAHTMMKHMYNAKAHDDFIPATREALLAVNRPYIIENVPGAETLSPHVVLCGTMFGLACEDAELRRHRLFESNVMLLQPACCHGGKPKVIGVYGGHGRDRRCDADRFFVIAERKQAMGIEWMTTKELDQAIPPAYTEYLGRQLMAYVQANSEVKA